LPVGWIVHRLATDDLSGQNWCVFDKELLKVELRRPRSQQQKTIGISDHSGHFFEKLPLLLPMIKSIEGVSVMIRAASPN
jgi:hypothetical protein